MSCSALCEMQNIQLTTSAYSNLASIEHRMEVNLVQDTDIAQFMSSGEFTILAVDFDVARASVEMDVHIEYEDGSWCYPEYEKILPSDLADTAQQVKISCSDSGPGDKIYIVIRAAVAVAAEVMNVVVHGRPHAACDAGFGQSSIDHDLQSSEGFSDYALCVEPYVCNLFCSGNEQCTGFDYNNKGDVRTVARASRKRLLCEDLYETFDNWSLEGKKLGQRTGEQHVHTCQLDNANTAAM